MSKRKRCDICGKLFDGWGNNPSPYEGETCCDECNKLVVQTRIGLLTGGVLFKKEQPFNLNSSYEIQNVKPKNGERFTLAELEEMVGGAISITPYKQLYTLVDNKEIRDNDLLDTTSSYSKNLFREWMYGDFLWIPNEFMPKEREVK